MTAMTLRFPNDDERRALEAIARVDGASLSAVVHEAIRAHIATRRDDPEFRVRVEQVIAEDAALLRRLAVCTCLAGKGTNPACQVHP